MDPEGPMRGMWRPLRGMVRQAAGGAVILDEFRALGLLRTLGLFAVAALLLVALGASWWLLAAVLS